MSALGSQIAQALTGSWRSAPPTTTLTAGEWARAAPALHATAAGGLGWWALQGSSLERAPVAEEFKDDFRLHTLHARVQERRLVRALELFEAAGIRPILAKGWAVARSYPSPGLRPYGDLDFHVAPEEHGAAVTLVEEHADDLRLVDLHRGIPRLRRPWGDVAARSVEAELGATRVRVLGAEDHLALLCVHLLSHGAWRPLWLCDVALLVETLPADFDWAYLRDLPARQVQETRLTALVAQRLLGARLDRTPWGAGEAVPEWLPTAMLGAWGRGGHYSITTRIALAEPHPRRLLEAVRIRWPNPIEATVRWRAPYNGLPRLPFQVLDALARSARALLGAPGVLLRRARASSDGAEQAPWPGGDAPKP